ncbi:hypothetical protein M430DRAFT_241161 [Amorphotheca resinae ATCC 22711]|uniref:Uncharacterized protein n=1 Tax=Amorphotheca resinae ATCC 22711 TaxID=857342 RepID=A0A2T3B1X6_AMORE|nr:hypothetical protein M430DRAFT_241161 [Amorphotheca resinae ATCC 22711]PSS18560.1 hypothetical protein M430DRAFT_241161 [Amorphotheca resinae ATCC 22711]
MTLNSVTGYNNTTALHIIGIGVHCNTRTSRLLLSVIKRHLAFMHLGASFVYLIRDAGFFTISMFAL